MEVLKRKWFSLCVYNIYFALMLYPFLGYTNTVKIDKKEMVYHTLPFVVLSVFCFVYVYQYYRKEEKKKSLNLFKKIAILISKVYVFISLIIAPFLMFNHIVFSIIFMALGIGGIYYLVVYCRTERDFL